MSEREKERERMIEREIERERMIERNEIAAHNIDFRVIYSNTDNNCANFCITT